jgi:hypothetical protein
MGKWSSWSATAARPAGLVPLGVGQFESLLPPLAAVARDRLGGGQLAELLGPLVAVAAGGQPTAPPAQAGLLDGPQHWLFAREELVGGHLLRARPGELVQHR